MVTIFIIMITILPVLKIMITMVSMRFDSPTFSRTPETRNPG